MATPLVQLVEEYLGVLVLERGFSVRAPGDQESEFGALVFLTTEDFEIIVSRDRGYEAIDVGIRGDRASRRPLGHLKGFLLGEEEPSDFATLEEAAAWLIEHASDVLDQELLRSDSLLQWLHRWVDRFFLKGGLNRRRKGRSLRGRR